MKKATVLLACLVCLPVIACKPGKIMRGAEHGQRSEERGGKHHGGLRRSCRDDIEKFCADKAKSERRECLQAHLNDLSADCKTAVEARKGRGGRRKGGDSDDKSDD
jgi:hypothetical protein